jgi:hypothetical protein
MIYSNPTEITGAPMYRVAWCSKQDYTKTASHLDWQESRKDVLQSVQELNKLDKTNFYYVERRGNV